MLAEARLAIIALPMDVARRVRKAQMMCNSRLVPQKSGGLPDSFVPISAKPSVQPTKLRS
eukprot:6983414-Pyramimonas_sp.AAC.1